MFDSLEVLCYYYYYFFQFAVSWIGETLTQAAYVETTQNGIVQQCCTIQLDKMRILLFFYIHIFIGWN